MIALDLTSSTFQRFVRCVSPEWGRSAAPAALRPLLVLNSPSGSGPSAGGNRPVRWLEPVGGIRVEPRVRSGQVRELGQERLVVSVHPVAERHLVADQESGDHLELDVDHVVHRPPAVREAGVVAADHPEAVRVLGRLHTQVELQGVHRGAGVLA